MGKAKLAVCMENPTYQERFVKCLMHHYRENYEMHSFSNMLDLESEQAGEFDLFILEGNGLEADAEQLAERNENILFLSEEQKKSEDYPNLIYVEMFQEVYKIMEAAKQLLGIQAVETADSVKRIGVYSLECPALQLPYCAMLASIYGVAKKVLVLHLLPHSGMTKLDEEAFCFEDVIAAVSTGTSTGSRMVSGIGHMAKWDYMYPVKNTEHLAEIGVKSYEGVLERVIREQGYEVVIINFGAPFWGMFEFMESCEEFYLLQQKGIPGEWRENDFRQEIERRGKDAFSNRISKIEIPFVSGTGDSWQNLAEKWEWGALGDHVRNRIRMGKTSG